MLERKAHIPFNMGQELYFSLSVHNFILYFIFGDGDIQTTTAKIGIVCALTCIGNLIMNKELMQKLIEKQKLIQTQIVLKCVAKIA